MWNFWQLVEIKIAPWYSGQHAQLTNKSPHPLQARVVQGTLQLWQNILTIKQPLQILKTNEIHICKCFSPYSNSTYYFGSELLSRKRHPVLVLPRATGDIYVDYNSFYFYVIQNKKDHFMCFIHSRTAALIMLNNLLQRSSYYLTFYNID